MILSPDIQLPHGFLSNQNGVSTGLYSSLNCGPGSDDDAELIAENRRIASSLIAQRRDTPIVSLYQIHSADVVTVDDDWGNDRPKADAMVTKHSGLILGILTADCTPVIFADEKHGIIGAAHAGWKGALGGVLENTICAMEALGATRETIHAAVGPTIHQPSYEVGTDFRSRFLNVDSSFGQFFSSGQDADHLQFNLPGFVNSQLKRSSIKSIWHANVDTYTSDNHFSYRRTTHKNEPDYGRQLSAVMLPANGT